MQTVCTTHTFVGKLIMTTNSYIKTIYNAIRITLVLLLVCNFSLAQDALMKSEKPFPLDSLKGYTQTFYYSNGQEERANRIAVFMESAGDYFQKEIKFAPKSKLYILSPLHWEDFAAKPLKDVYGFPHNKDDGNLVIAAEDNDFWRSFLPPMNQLPLPIATAVTNAYGKLDGTVSMMPFFDLLALHELGHSYTSQAGLKMHRYWMNELFVNIMLHTYVAEVQTELLPALETFPNMVVGAGTAEFKYTSLDDFEKLYQTLGMGPKNYGWYQCKLHSASKDIYNSGGKEVLNKLWIALKKHQEDMTDEEFISMLNKEVHPSFANVFSKWNKVD